MLFITYFFCKRKIFFCCHGLWTRIYENRKLLLLRGHCLSFSFLSQDYPPAVFPLPFRYLPLIFPLSSYLLILFSSSCSRHLSLATCLVCFYLFASLSNVWVSFASVNLTLFTRATVKRKKTQRSDHDFGMGLNASLRKSW